MSTHDLSIASDEMTLKDLIQNVERNERLYSEIDVILAEQYRSTTREIKDASKESGRLGTPVQDSNERVHFVSQGGKFRAEVESTKQMVSGTHSTKSRRRLFDATTTRLLDSSKEGEAGTANIIEGRADDEKVVRPHMLLLRNTRKVIPLSVYMKGREAIAAYPYGDLSPGVDLSVEYKGAVTYKNLRCHIVWLTNTLKSSGALHDRWVLWLAEERNYIPIRREGYTFRWSNDIPVGEGEVTDWKEVLTGVWYPMSAEVTRYHSSSIAKGKKELQWKNTYTTENVSLDPKYDASYFVDLTIPDGSAVYNVADKKITSSHRQGQPGITSTQSSTWRNTVIFWGTLVAVMILGGFVFVRQKHRRIGLSK